MCKILYMKQLLVVCVQNITCFSGCEICISGRSIPVWEKQKMALQSTTAKETEKRRPWKGLGRTSELTGYVWLQGWSCQRVKETLMSHHPHPWIQVWHIQPVYLHLPLMFPALLEYSALKLKDNGTINSLKIY